MATTEHQQRLLDQQPLKRVENFYEKVALSEKVAARITARVRCVCVEGDECDLHQRVSGIVTRYLRYCDATILTCPCGEKHSRRSWAGLELIGEQGDEFELMELRNCTCHSTITRVLWRASCRACGKRPWAVDELEIGAICEPCFDGMGSD